MNTILIPINSLGALHYISPWGRFWAKIRNFGVLKLVLVAFGVFFFPQKVERVFIREGMIFIMWAATWQNQQCGCAPSEDSDIRCPGWSESSLDAHSFCSFVMLWLIWQLAVSNISITVMIQRFWTNRSVETVRTQIRLMLSTYFCGYLNIQIYYIFTFITSSTKSDVCITVIVTIDTPTERGSQSRHWTFCVPVWTVAVSNALFSQVKITHSCKQTWLS